MFLAVIVELADSHFRDLVLSCISPYPFGIDLIFLCNLFGGVILGDVKVLFGYDAFVRLGLHHRLDVRTADERLLPAQTGGPQFGFLDQFIDVLPCNTPSALRLGQKRRNPAPRLLVEVAIIPVIDSTVAYVP